MFRYIDMTAKELAHQLCHGGKSVFVFSSDWRRLKLASLTSLLVCDFPAVASRSHSLFHIFRGSYENRDWLREASCLAAISSYCATLKGHE